MQRKLTIMVDTEVYQGLRKVIGPGNISEFIQELLHSPIVHPNLESGYAEMANDTVKWLRFLRQGDKQ